MMMRTLGRLAVATVFLGAISGCTSEPNKGPVETAGKKVDDAAAAAAGAAKDAAKVTGDAAETAAGAAKDVAKDAARATEEAAAAAAGAAKDAAHGTANIAKDAAAVAKDAAGNVAAGAKDVAKDAAAAAADAAHATGKALDSHGAGGKVMHLDRLILTIDVANFVPRADFDVEEIAESLGRGHQQVPSIGDRAADIVGQAAVGERDVAASLEDKDLRPFIHAAEPRRARRPTGHPADDQYTFVRHDR
jgi:hypothetical protein